MQRLQLHFRGIQVPALGSPKDRIFRDYLAWETRTEAAKHEMQMLIAMGSANIRDEKRSEWVTGVRKSYSKLISLLCGIEPKEISDEDQVLLNFYEQVVKPSKVKLGRSADGRAVAVGVPGANQVAPSKTEQPEPKSTESLKVQKPASPEKVPFVNFGPQRKT